MADTSHPNPQKASKRFVVYDKLDRTKWFSLDPSSAQTWALEPHQSDWDSWQNYFRQTTDRTLFRLGNKRWVLIEEESHVEVPFPLGDPTYELLTDIEAAEQLLMSGHTPPDDLIHLVQDKLAPPSPPAETGVKADAHSSTGVCNMPLPSAGQLRAIADDARTLAGLIQTALSIGSDFSFDSTFALYLRRLQRSLTNKSLEMVTSIADFQVLHQLSIRVDAIATAAEKSDYEPKSEDVATLEYAVERIDKFLRAKKPIDANAKAPAIPDEKTRQASESNLQRRLGEAKERMKAFGEGLRQFRLTDEEWKEVCERQTEYEKPLRALLEPAGIPYPETIDEWGILAYALGIDPGPLTLAQIYDAAVIKIRLDQAARVLTSPGAGPPAVPLGTSPSASVRPNKLEWLAKAMLMVREHPEWPDSKIADEVGVNKGTLSRSKEYQAASGMARAPKRTPRKGHVDIDSETGKQRGIEAYDDDDNAETDN
jgi:hypothetical protein